VHRHLPCVRLFLLGPCLLAWAGCPTEHLLLGVARDAGQSERDAGDAGGFPQDAEPELDAQRTEDADTHEGDAGVFELHARFDANGRKNVVQLSPSCLGSCIEVEVVVEGGTPPYRVEWEDGSLGATRLLCVYEDTLPTATVSDDGAEPESLSLELSTFGFGYCGDAGVETTVWTTCFAPEAVVPPCQSEGSQPLGTVFDLGESVDEGTYLQVDALFEGTTATPIAVQIDASEDGCVQTETLGSGSIWLLAAPLTTPVLNLATSLSVPASYLQVYSPNAPDGLLPSELSIASLTVCEQR
jgi:hypothetical protein